MTPPTTIGGASVPAADRPLTAGDEIHVRMRVTTPESRNDYRGLYYIMCADPWDDSEDPIPVLESNIVRRPAASDGGWG